MAESAAMYRLCAVVLVATVAGVATLVAARAPQPDALAAEIARWQAEAERDRPGVPIWTQVQPGSRTALAHAKEALDKGHRWFALERLAAARQLLSAAAFVASRPDGARKGIAPFEAEWSAVGASLGGAVAVPAPESLRTIGAAGVRALAEASAFQTKVLYDASLIYGRATDADSGFYYLGSALAQQEFLTVARTLPAVTGRRPTVRSLAPELAALERSLLSLYLPPVSIERHAEFISASSALKEAREQDAAGLRYGALLNYLRAVQRTALLRVSAGRSVNELTGQLAAARASLGGPDVDHSLASLFLDRVAFEVTRETPDPVGLRSSTVVLDSVIPAYRAALGAAPALAPPVAATVTVRLVRWPFT